MSGRDYYEEARKLADNLAAEGFEDWAARIRGAIERGFTATEILMALRWEAKELRSSDLPLASETLQRLESLLNGLEEALR